MKTTLNEIRKHYPCRGGWTQLLAHLGKTKADDEPLPIIEILSSNGLDDALWCLRAVAGHDRSMRLYAVWCARQVQHLMDEASSGAALDVADRRARGLASDNDLTAAWAAARDAAGDAAGAVARDDAWAAARDAARAAQSDELRRVCQCIESGGDPYPETTKECVR